MTQITPQTIYFHTCYHTKNDVGTIYNEEKGWFETCVFNDGQLIVGPLIQTSQLYAKITHHNRKRKYLAHPVEEINDDVLD